MSAPVKESTRNKAPSVAQIIADQEQRIAQLEQRIVQLEGSAHTEHTLGPDVVDQLVKQVIQRIGNGLVSLVQQPAE